MRALRCLLALTLALCLCSCKAAPTVEDGDPNEIDMGDFVINPDNGDSSDQSNNGSAPEAGKESVFVNGNTPANQNTDNNKTDETPDGGNNASWTEPDEAFTPMQIPSRNNAYKLTNTYNKLTGGNQVNVAYFGGSVTSGTGASDDSKTSWRALTTAYLNSISPGNVHEIDVALGGSGSYLGAARFQHDVISAKPDLLIIEFSVNDGYSGIAPELAKMNLEYMIRALHNSNPSAEIVIALITNKTVFGVQYENYEAYFEVADYYGIPIVDLGGELYNRLEGSYSEFVKCFTDSVHPNDTGHKIYADIMIAALKELLRGNAGEHPFPAQRLCGNGYSQVTNLLADTFNENGWSKYSWFNNTTYEKSGSQFRYSYLKNQFSKYLAPDNVGASITVKFTGNSFGIIGTIKEKTGLKIVLDGQREKNISGTTNTGMCEYPVFYGLANTSHTVTVTVTGSEPYAAIAAFVTTKQ